MKEMNFRRGGGAEITTLVFDLPARGWAPRDFQGEADRLYATLQDTLPTGTWASLVKKFHTG